MHARRAILYDHKGSVWTKKDSKYQFDVSMGTNDGAEICFLVWLYIHTEVYKDRFHQCMIIPRRASVEHHEVQSTGCMDNEPEPSRIYTILYILQELSFLCFIQILISQMILSYVSDFLHKFYLKVK